jgi:pSer/pThr/pTyr-binding forkhead associated (FHA) protein
VADSLGRGIKRSLRVIVDSFKVLCEVQNAQPNEPQVFLQRALDQQQLTIGRSDESDIQLDGLLISNDHARISQTAEGVVIEDLNSTNGTYVNGQRITARRPITYDDMVQIGPFLLRVSTDRGSQSLTHERKHDWMYSE